MSDENNNKKNRRTINLRETEFLKKLAATSNTRSKSIADDYILGAELHIPIHVWLGCTVLEFSNWKKTGKWPENK